MDPVKGFAMIWILADHVVENLFGGPFFGNPSARWPPIAERVSQLKPLDGYGVWDIPVNFIRYFGWFGDQAVQVFIILSGIGLAWGILARHGLNPVEPRGFYLRRLERIYPLWWGAHILFLGTFLLLDWGLSYSDYRTWASFLGIRFTRELMYYFSPAWWYIGLAIQLYLVFPFLWNRAVRKGRPERFLLTVLFFSLAVRGIGLFYFAGYLDSWSRGSIFISRLPEFIFGMILALRIFQGRTRTDDNLGTAGQVWLAGVVYIMGTFLSLSLTGMIFAPLLLGIGATILLVGAFRWIGNASVVMKSFRWVGEHSYSIFLVHHPVVNKLVPPGWEGAGSLGLGIRLAAALIITVVGALLLERFTDHTWEWLKMRASCMGIRKLENKGRII